MHLSLVIGNFIFAFASINCGPLPEPRSVYDHILQSDDPNKKCPFLRESILIKPQPSFLSECTDLSQERAITKIRDSNIDKVLCVPFYNSFERLCYLSNNITYNVGQVLFAKEVLTEKLAGYQSNGNLSCEILEKNVDERLTEGMASTFKLFSKEKCLNICSEPDDVFKHICSFTAMMANISKEIENNSAGNGKINQDTSAKSKPTFTENLPNVGVNFKANSDVVPADSNSPQGRNQDPDKIVKSTSENGAVETSSNHDGNKGTAINSTENSSIKNIEHGVSLSSSPVVIVKSSTDAGTSEKMLNQDLNVHLTKGEKVDDEPFGVTLKSEKISDKAEEQPLGQRGNEHDDALANGVEEVGAAPDKEDFQVAGDETLGDLHQDTKPIDTSNDIDEEEGMEQTIKNEENEAINDFPPKSNQDQTKDIEKSKPLETEDGPAFAANYQNQNIDDSDSYFFSYFMMVCIMFIFGYVAYHNKQKILALVVEGRRGRRPSRTRRPNSANYRKLDSNLEEAVTSSCNKNATQVIY